MILKSLEMQGFKSFPDKTVLTFDKGITCVVGPNGSGKSNVSDAVRWVLGEQSTKSLRGSKMEDVVFSGTGVRRAQGFAEVTLRLDNRDRALSLDEDEVAVTRRYYRSGEGEYRINGNAVRLKDIHELFMDTGLGRDGYSMIGQGNVSQILSTKAEDRRSFFEEAAGVSKFKHRKDEAQRKLVSVQENLTRINDIAGELESRLGPLEHQSRKARKYMELYGEYKNLDVSMSLIMIGKNKEAAGVAEEQRRSVQDEIERLKEQETDIEAQQNALYLKSQQKDEEQAQKNQELIDNEARSMAAQNAISMAENDIKNNNAMMERIGQEIDGLSAKNADLEAQIEASRQRVAEQEAESKELLARFEQIQAENAGAFDELAECRKRIDAVKGDIIERMNDIAAKKAQISGMETLRRNFLERRETVENERKSHGLNIEAVRKEIEEHEAKAAGQTEKQAAMQKRVDEGRERLAAYQEQAADIRKACGDLEVELNSKTSKRRILEGMENEYEGYARSVKAVLKAPELKRLAIYGTVSGLIDVRKEYVTAIEISLGGALQNIVVETEEDAKRAIAYLREHKAGRATFLPVSSVSGRTLDNIREIAAQPGFIGVASDLIRYDRKYDGIMKSLLGRVVVVDNIDNAIALSRKFSYKFRTVTLEGDILNAGGAMSGGSVNKSSGFLSRAQEIKTLAAEIAELTKKRTNLRAQQAELEEHIGQASRQLSSYEPLLREYENEVLVLRNTAEHMKQTLASSGESERALELELEQIEEQLAKSGDEIAALINSVRTAETALEKDNETVAEMEREYEHISAKKDQKAKELMDETLRLRSLEKDIQTIKASAEEMRRMIAENLELSAQKGADRERVHAANAELQQRIAEKTEEIAQINQVSAALKAQIQEIEKEKAAVVEGLKDMQNSNKDLTDRMLLLQQELSRVEHQREKLEGELESILNRLWDEYELTPSTAEAAKIEIENEAEAKKRVTELKGKIKALGSVNVDAIAEYNEAKERFEFLSDQKADLEKAQADLNKVIDSMQELMEEHFKKQFEEINKSFGHVFRELFGGGSGRLYLSDPGDVMESGIEIEAQLPGKGLQNINLYSGGEKSFIAIALLFSILEVKPTPFCLLDEIDAALDDVNVSRFATYLRNYLAQTQFIVITHRRGTMEAANVLYGVTMQEKGVSKLLALQIDDVGEEMLG